METVNTISALVLLGLLAWAAWGLLPGWGRADTGAKAPLAGKAAWGVKKRDAHKAARAGTGSAPAGALSPLAAPEEDAPLPLPWQIVLWALVAAGVALRIFRFGAVPGGFNQDGAMAAVDALALARHGTDRFGTWLPAHFTAWGYGQMSVLLSYCMVPFFWLFGMDSVTARLPMLLWSLAGLGGVYALARQLGGHRLGLFALAVLALCPWHFMQSRWALDCNVFPHAFLLGLALLCRGAKRPAALYGSMVFFALCMYSYGLAFLTVPLFLLLACALLLGSRRVSWKQVLLCLAIYLGLSWPIYVTMLINALGLETLALPFVTLPYFPQSVRSGDLIFFSDAPWEQLRLNARALWQVGFAQGPDLPWNAIEGFGTLFLWSWPLGLLGLGVALRRALGAEGERRVLWRLLLLYWIAALFTGLCVRQVNINRLNILFYAHGLFIAVGLAALLRLRPHAALPLLAVYALSACLFVQSYFGPWAERISSLFYEDFLSAVTMAAEQQPERLVITPDAQYTGSRAVSEILTLYALDLDDCYLRGESDETPSYRERFVYRNLTQEDLLAPAGGTVWVQKTASLPPDLPAGWQAQIVGDYCVLVYSGG